MNEAREQAGNRKERVVKEELDAEVRQSLSLLLLTAGGVVLYVSLGLLAIRVLG